LTDDRQVVNPPGFWPVSFADMDFGIGNAKCFGAFDTSTVIVCFRHSVADGAKCHNERKAVVVVNKRWNFIK